MKPNVLVLTGFGLNTEHELSHAFELAGAIPTRLHLNDLLEDGDQLQRFQILAIPGGFAHADDLGAGKVMAQQLAHHLDGELERFIEDEKLIFGVCNGFQVLAKLGLLPAVDGYGRQEVTITANDSGRFEDRWVHLKTEAKSPCVFTRGIERLYLPVRHGEGKFVPRDDALLAELEGQGQIAVRYVDASGKRDDYPWNPNGSVADVAGICDRSGRIFGLMPHPEAYLYRYNHPRWTREALHEEGDGLKIFKNAVAYFA